MAELEGPSTQGASVEERVGGPGGRFASVFENLEHSRGISCEDTKLDEYLTLKELFEKSALDLIELSQGSEASFADVKQCYENTRLKLENFSRILADLEANRDDFVFVEGIEDLCLEGRAKLEQLRWVCESEANYDRFLEGKSPGTGVDGGTPDPSHDPVTEPNANAELDPKKVEQFAAFEKAFTETDVFELLGISAFDAGKYSYDQVKEFYDQEASRYADIQRAIDVFRTDADLVAHVQDLGARCDVLDRKLRDFHEIMADQEKYEQLVKDSSLSPTPTHDPDPTGASRLTEYGSKFLEILGAQNLTFREKLGALGGWFSFLDNEHNIVTLPDGKVSHLRLALNNLTENGAHPDNLEVFVRHVYEVQSGVDSGKSKSVDELICGLDPSNGRLNPPPPGSLVGKTPADGHLEPYANVLQSLEKVLSNIALCLEDPAERQRVEAIKLSLEDSMKAFQEEYSVKRQEYIDRKGASRQEDELGTGVNERPKGFWRRLPFPVRAAIVAFPAAFVGGLVAQGPGYLGVLALTVYLMKRSENKKAKQSHGARIPDALPRGKIIGGDGPQPPIAPPPIPESKDDGAKTE